MISDAEWYGLGPKVRGRTNAGRAGVGGFYESIIALMVVSVGVLILTSSLAMIGSRNGRSGGMEDDLARETLDRLLADQALFPEDHMTSRSAHDHFDWSNLPIPSNGSWIKVWASYADGTMEIWYEGGNDRGDAPSYVASEAINVSVNGGEVRVALLSVQVVS